MTTEHDHRRAVQQAADRMEKALVRAADFLSSRLGVDLPHPLDPAEAERLSGVVQEQLSLLPPDQRRLTLIMRAPVLAELNAAMSRLAALQQDTLGRIRRLKCHSAAVAAYGRRRGAAAIN